MKSSVRNGNLGSKLIQLLGLQRSEHRPTDLLRRVRVYFDFLLSRPDACVLKDFHDSKHFGNEIVIFRSGVVACMAVHDRGDDYVEVGPACLSGERWLNLPVLLRTLGAPHFDRTVTWNLPDAAGLVKTHLQLLENGFSPENYERTLSQYDAVVRESTENRPRLWAPNFSSIISRQK